MAATLFIDNVEDADKRMKKTQRRYKADQDKGIRNASKNIEVGQYVYVDRPPVTSSTVEGTATQLYSQLLSVKTGLFRVVEVLPTIVTIDVDCIRNIVSGDQAKVAAAGNKTPIEDNRTQGD